ncbi:hypothetical protein G6F57_022478 [Rhizopus arrhizus]|nr:hypothetical protein G6F57_022478 [Rhizopus arrhizus]
MPRMCRCIENSPVLHCIYSGPAFRAGGLPSLEGPYSSWGGRTTKTIGSGYDRAMNRRLLLSAGVAVAATVAGGLTLLGRKSQNPAAPADAGDPVAGLMQLQMPDLNGATQSLSGWKGQPIVGNFWATWCAPCRC